MSPSVGSSNTGPEMSAWSPTGISLASGWGTAGVEGSLAASEGAALVCNSVGVGWGGSTPGVVVGEIAGELALAAGVRAEVDAGAGAASVNTGSGAMRRGAMRAPELSSTGPCVASDGLGLGVGVACGRVKVLGLLCASPLTDRLTATLANTHRTTVRREESKSKADRRRIAVSLFSCYRFA